MINSSIAYWKDTVSPIIYIFLNGTAVNNLQDVTNYFLILGSVCGVKDEKAIANKMDICHSCLTYFEVTGVWGTLSGLEDLTLVNIFRLILYK